MDANRHAQEKPTNKGFLHRDLRWICATYRMPPINPLEQHRQLRRRERDHTVRGLAPHEASSLQALRKETQSITTPTRESSVGAVRISVLVGGMPWLPQSISLRVICGCCGGPARGTVCPRAVTAAIEAASSANDLFMGTEHQISPARPGFRALHRLIKAQNDAARSS
jgi:hypothetical protein